MQFLATQTAYYIKSIRTILKCCRSTSCLSVVDHSGLADEPDIHIIGDIRTFIGKIYVEGIYYLLVVVEQSSIGKYGPAQAEIFRIDRVAAIPVINNGRIDRSFLDGSMSTIEKLKNSQKKLMKFVSDKIAAGQKMLIDEILKLFNANGDFYYSKDADLTLSIPKSLVQKTSDDRYFWNKHLLNDLYTNGIPLSNTSEWITPIIQGFAAQKVVDFDDLQLTLILISRRSIKRAGVRYLKRGVDEDGNVANFVETEFIMNLFEHFLSYIQIRGSVPMFWSQRGYRYRPPLVIEKQISESLPVFEKHIKNLTQDYDIPITVINLVDQTGRELCLAENLLKHILALDSPEISYFSFDFHQQCRALQFQKVSNLISALESELTKIGFYWIDKTGQMLLKQKGVVRTNCVDCLDRTNVVQGAISQAVCLTQLRKLGLIGPLCEPPENLTQTLQLMWADNGDSISRQYAGTNALKGDFTRTGQRKFLGVVKDGYNSASRYYLAQMKDARRQRAIDAIISGRSVEAVLKASKEEVESEDENEVENIGRLVHETIHFVLPENEVLVSSWALVDGGNPTDQIDTVMLLTRSHVYVALYDEDSEKLLELKTIAFSEIQRIELGSLSNGKTSRVHLRIYWKASEDTSSERSNSTLYMSWRAAKTRLFNNVAIPLKSAEEADEYIQAIAEQLRVTIEMCAGYEVPLVYVKKLSGSASNKNKTSFINMFTSGFKLRNVPSSTFYRKSNGSQTDVSKFTDLATVQEAPIIEVDDVPKTPKDNTFVFPVDPTRLNGKEEELEVPKSPIPISKSDGLLVQTAATENPINGGGIVAKLQARLKGPTKSSPDLQQLDPFQVYRQQILNSKSLIILL
uniref:SAC domain-containing protein n=1 Tax=Acrobeloides nanus TaxID=290746 RepID=A0A914C5A7_9BILA